MEGVVIHWYGGSPVVAGSWKKAAGRPSVLIYGHYGVQPVAPLHSWKQDPFSPHDDNDRIFARGAADDKGQILMHIQAVAAILQAKGKLPVNVIESTRQRRALLRHFFFVAAQSMRAYPESESPFSVQER